jgi:hypothetical protein
MNRPFAIAAILAFIIVAAVLQPDINDFLWTHAWWRAFLVALPPLGLTLVGIIVQVRQSRESDSHRRRANQLQEEANGLRRELDAERNA